MVSNNPQDIDVHVKEAFDDASPITCCVNSKQGPNISNGAVPPEHGVMNTTITSQHPLHTLFSLPSSISGQQS